MIYDWLQNITFVWPENFILLGILPFLIWSYINNERRASGSMMASAVPAKIPETFKNRLRHLPFILRMLALLCLIMALARPQHQTDKSRSEGEGIDIVLCMDVSGSMGTEDVVPNRFSVAKDVAIEFVKNRPVDRIGLVIFAGESFTKSPITSDRNAVLNQLGSLKIMDGGYLETGTLIGEGLAMSVNRISKGTGKSRVVILLTDGKEDAPPTRIIDPEMAMEIAKANNVKVYCIGLGSATRTAEQIVTDIAGNSVRNYIDETLLKRIASNTGGRYYRAIDRPSLQAIYSQIDRLEKSKVEIIKYKEVKEMFIPLVLAALCWLFLEVVLRFTIFKKFP
ncbi:vWA domain-containing protein [Niabella insulamsoli]|uniref:vWA domain-containing protein n=1 Tax=Niabella insulamsoli TaxID=3144874 RepID=UPI0031FBCBDB